MSNERRVKINSMIHDIINTVLPWIQNGNDELLRFIDPLDKEEISAHYGATHAAAALIIFGEEHGELELAKKGYALLDSILRRWNDIKILPAFHNDFNNFALSVICDYLNKRNLREGLQKQIHQLILSTQDSNNPTVNWIPMRWYVNLVRYRITGEKKYQLKCIQCRKEIEAASFKDGFIDDRLPKGLSFNLQYNVATVAVMQFLRNQGENIDISVNLGALLNACCPDGDINYLGRGTNQIFAWGLWIYLLASSGKEKQLHSSFEFLVEKLPTALKNNNIMLNDYPGEEKYLWWDYHYCSVYTAHLLLWLVLSEIDYDAMPVNEQIMQYCDSGMHIYRTENYFVSVFDGRKEYFCERGPAIQAIWTKKTGTIQKGIFGPLGGSFGNLYSYPDAVLKNFFGVYRYFTPSKWSRYFPFNKLLNRNQKIEKMTAIPLLEKPIVDINHGLTISWSTKSITLGAIQLIVINGDGKHIDDLIQNIDDNNFIYNGSIRNQYGICTVYTCKINSVSSFYVSM